MAGTLMQVSGTLLVKKADGRAKVLSQQSVVEQGDTLISEKETYARIRFSDGSDITLEPDSRLTIDAPSVFSLAAGGLRGSGQFTLKTPAGTVEVRGTIVASFVPASASDQAAYDPILLAALESGTLTDAPLIFAQAAPAKPGGLLPGLHVFVIDGAITLSNKGGALNFSAGQFGYTANIQKPPVVVPGNPGLKFTPPPMFSSSSTSQGSSSGQKAAAVDCEVR